MKVAVVWVKFFIEEEQNLFFLGEMTFKFRLLKFLISDLCSELILYFIFFKLCYEEILFILFRSTAFFVCVRGSCPSPICLI